ncbi:hypothetical protein BDN72DRAFT_513910 [Pluteus cervinus]|uniref:Uncharacterized protein n=1 Tax=Pluteus cervinus TaxID=181527 RepID=A0ACD3BBA5_9AGAR|nr:hypothetical protein BDN72DRAFT_513910 [Pluteus cervinus]
MMDSATTVIDVKLPVDSAQEVDDGLDTLALLGEHLINSILEQEPLPVLTSIIENGAPLWYQNQAEGISCLHAAAYIQDVDLVKLLVEKGAVWNSVDYLKHTAGDIALSFNNVDIYALIRDAGIRSELLLSRLSSQTSLQATDSTTILRQADNTGAGSLDTFLSSRLRFTVDGHGQSICSIDVEGEEIGVMMGWEAGIMQETVRRLCQGHKNDKELKILNIGFGLGIIDTLFQSTRTRPTKHVIIEAHPDVLQHMKQLGWYDKEGVEILEGKWQDFIREEGLLGGNSFDVVYTDTFSEDYEELHRFFKYLPMLFSGSGSRFSFFNGLGATNAMFYDVYTHISELHLSQVGLDVEWSDVDVGESRDSRWGSSRQYFSLPTYRLPIAKLR